MGNVYEGGENIIDQSGSHMSPRTDISPNMYDNLIKQKGYRLIWEQALFCPCMNLESGQPDYECKSCYGRGYKYIRPKRIRALVTSINGRKDQHRIGLEEVGGAYLTPSSSDNVGFRDRFIFVDFTTKFSEVLVKGDVGSVDSLRYYCLEVEALFTKDKEYYYGIDFEITKEGTGISWIKEEPYTGTQYSILYNIRPVYIAMNPIHELRGTYTKEKAHGMEKFVKLPKQFQIKREDFLEDDTSVMQNDYKG